MATTTATPALQDLYDEADALREELKTIQADIDNERKLGNSLVHHYRRYNNCEEKIENTYRQIRECHPTVPEKPKVLTDTQSVISIASVQRKTPFALVKTQTSLDPFRRK